MIKASVLFIKNNVLFHFFFVHVFSIKYEFIISSLKVDILKHEENKNDFARVFYTKKKYKCYKNV